MAIEDFESDDDHRPASDGQLLRWGLGAIVPALLAIYAVRCMMTASAIFFQSRPLQVVEMHGASAVAVGLLYVFLAALLHSLLFWREHRYHGFGELGAIASIVGIVASVLLLIYFYIVVG